MAHFYKYVTPETGQKIIENGTLRWSTPFLLNDPFDMQFAFQFRIDHAAARAMALEKNWEHHYGKLHDRPLNKLGQLIRQTRDQFPKMTREEFDETVGSVIDELMELTKRQLVEFNKQIVEDGFSNDKIICFTKDPENILMWSYYAQNHSGIVLRFTDETPDNPLSQARQVDYVSEMPSLFNEETLSDILSGYDVLNSEFLINEVVWTKSSHWAHEQEWRIYSGLGRTVNSYEDIPFTKTELDGVIFGIRTDIDYQNHLTKLTNDLYPHVELLQAKKNNHSYSMAIEKLTH